MLNLDETWFKDAMREAPVKSFMDSDGDGIGDFAGMIEKLDYIRDLGVVASGSCPCTLPAP